MNFSLTKFANCFFASLHFHRIRSAAKTAHPTRVTIQGDRITMFVQRLVFSVLAALALNGCAQVTPIPFKEAAPVNLSAEPYRPHTLDEYPDFTPEELGRRMLKLIDSLESFDELSLERIRKVTELPMYSVPHTSRHIFDMESAGWYYFLSYYDHPQLTESKNITYEFLGENDVADMAPVCTIDYRAYVKALRSIGFQEREDMAQYDALHPYPRRNEKTGVLEYPSPQSRRLPVYFFTRGNVVVQIIARREADAPPEKLLHACVESISAKRL